jgi:hypothetical protein
MKIKQEPPIFGNVQLCAVISNKEVIEIPKKIRYRNFVYMLTLNDKVIYVGRSTNLRHRLNGWNRCREFDKVYLCEYLTHKENCKAERYYINHYNPSYNKR